MPIDTVPPELELAITILENETRRQIFDRLWRVSWMFGPDDLGLTFEELRQLVDVNSAPQLSYHLEIMKEHGEAIQPDTIEYGPDGETPPPGSSRGKLVRQKDGRYHLLIPMARRIIRIWALALPKHPELGPTDVPFTCPYCGAGVRAVYGHHRLGLYCPEHREVEYGMVVPGNGADQSIMDIIRLNALEKTRRAMLCLSGFCIACFAGIERTIVSTDRESTPITDVLDDSAVFPYVVGEDAYSWPDNQWQEPIAMNLNCSNCGEQGSHGIGKLTCYRPAAIDFFAEHDVDPFTTPMMYRFVEEAGTVLSLDPVRVKVVLTADGTSRTFIVDDRCRIVSSSLD